MTRTDRTRSPDCVVPADEWAWIENTLGLCDPLEGEHLANLAATVPADQTIVEIGSHTGQSTLWLAAGSRHGFGAHIVAVDPWPDPGYALGDDPFDLGSGDAVLRRFFDNVRGTTQLVPRESYADLVTPLRLTSRAAAAGWVAPIGLLFLDALHDYKNVKADVELWSPFVPVGGWLALNDYYRDPKRTRLRGPGLIATKMLEPSGHWDECAVVWNTWVGRRIGH